MRRTVTGEHIPALLRTTRRGAFKFEQRDTYLVEEDDAVLDAWLRGEASADDGLEPWLELIRELTRSGRAVRRARMVTLPPTDYIRFEAAAVPASVAAGEDIRYLDRADVGGLPAHDFWLVDDQQLLLLHFDERGAPLEHELTDDPAEIARHQVWARRAWQRATPYADFAARLA